MTNSYTDIDTVKIERSISMINDYVKDDCVKPVIAVLESIKNNPDDTALIEELKTVLDTIGIVQGAVLTYAPYVTVLISDDPFSRQ